MLSFILAAGLSIEFIGPCSVRPLLQASLPVSSSNVGQASVATLENFEIAFQGNESGLNSAFGTPTGMAALEILSDNEMRSYGWCYSIDGAVPEVFPNAIPLTHVQREVRWFFAYAHYLNGEWVSQCEPAYQLRPAFLCHSSPENL